MMEDVNKDIKQCRKYLKILDEITDLVEMLPDIDDASMDFYEYINNLIAKEDVRVNKKLKRIEMEMIK